MPGVRPYKIPISRKVSMEAGDVGRMQLRHGVDACALLHSGQKTIEQYLQQVPRHRVGRLPLDTACPDNGIVLAERADLAPCGWSRPPHKEQ